MEEKNNNTQEIIIYQTDDGAVKIDVQMADDTVWLTIDGMSKLFEKSRSTINEHILNIFEEGELNKDDAVRKIGNSDFSTKPTNFYNLDVIISVGYRVKSLRGTQFRIWATKRLNEYIRKGFTLDDARLKNLGGGGYWKELIERIRDIRSSEKVFYRQILDIYATSIDYNPKAEISIEFFKRVQNKIHYAVHGQTAAEVIVSRADAEKEFMGLTTFEGDRPHLKDAVIAKNYLNENELRAMGQIVSGYLDFAERQAERQQTMTMNDWAMHLDKILTMSGEKLLQDAGQVSHQQAIEHATNEYKKYQQRTLSQVEKDFLDNIKTLPNK
ncbi:MAG: virulence RhuM family protein [Bacteroidales bacterium]|nr:virulence RhuM family protein [Bacteroidales bacterium]